jgi:AdoMet-dependent rRNA methyltransferase SPB1
MRRERRRNNEKKQKEIVRMQLHMTAPTEIGLEQAQTQGNGSMFALKEVEKSGATNRIAAGKMTVMPDRPAHDSKLLKSAKFDGESDESDLEEDRLERHLDSLYEQYQERRSELSAKFRAKKGRKEYEDGDWEGFSTQSSSDDDQMQDDSDASSTDDQMSPPHGNLLTDLEIPEDSSIGLTKRAAQFFDQDIFKNIDGLNDECGQPVLALHKAKYDAPSDEDVQVTKHENDVDGPKASLDLSSKTATSPKIERGPLSEQEDDSEHGDANFEIVKHVDSKGQWEASNEPWKNGRLGNSFIHAT